jgi:2',3'-cyclic-nucleotide 2'-phosphodiesterase/3'-nucleotidase
MKRLMLLGLLIVAALLSAAQTKTLYILNTTDVHAEILGYDFSAQKPLPRGLAQVKTTIDQLRHTHENVVLLDGGDMMQGNIMAYYYNHVADEREHPLINAMNLLGYDAAAVGNHEMEQGSDFMTILTQQSDFPWLAANGLNADGTPHFLPYTIIRTPEFSVGVVGLTVPVSPSMAPTSHQLDIHWADMVHTAAAYARVLRPQVDVLVGLCHAGFDDTKGSILPGRPVPNASRLVAEQVPQFDVILAGHTHRFIPPIGEETAAADGVPLQVMAGSRGQAAALIAIELENRKVGWRVKSRKVTMLDMSVVQPDEAMTKRYEPYYQEAQEYMNTVICSTAIALDAADARRNDTTIVDLINRAQLAYFDAEISFTSAFTTGLQIAPGPVAAQDVFAMYPYENTLYLVEMTGRQIHDYLRYSARYFVYDEGAIIINSEMPGYQYDMAEGIDYTIVVQPDGTNTIRDLHFQQDGHAIADDDSRTYRVVINSYRMFGGGGYLHQQPTMLQASSVPARQVLSRYLQNLGSIITPANNNWEVVAEQ